MLILIFSGLIGYMMIEGYTFIEALYMTIITVTTVGFSEIRPLSDSGRIFTAILIIFSFGFIGFAASNITTYIINGVLRNYYKENKVKKRIKKLDKHVLVCGYGRVGKQACADLANHNEDFVLIERDEKLIEKIREETNYLYIHGDATQEEALEVANIDTAKAIISTLPNDADNIYVVLTAREMNPALRIISRASDDHSDSKLRKAGATNIIMPDKIGGQRMAKYVAQPDVVEFLEYLMLQAEDAQIEEVSCDHANKEFFSKSIRDFNIRDASGANIVGIKKANGQIIFNPMPDTVLTSEDKLFVIGNNEQIYKLKKILYHS